MFENKQNLVIVSDEKTSRFGDYLMQLISVQDDTDEGITGIKDGTVKAVHISDKEYIATKATITSDEKVIFIGNNKLTKNDCAYIDIKFKEYGMSYGWLGNRALLTVGKDAINKQQYDGLLTLGDKYKKQFEYKNTKLLGKLGIAVSLLTFSPIGIGTGIFLTALQKNKVYKAIQEQQYTLLVSIFYMDALQKFLEG